MSIFRKILGDATTPQKAGGESIQTAEINTDDGDLYATLKRSTVLHEARCFNEKQIDPRKCRKLLARLIYLINQGEHLSETESTELFFSITKLFQSENKELRRMIYLIIKEMQREPSLYIITQSLIKDMNAKEDLFRMNALRLSAAVIEPQYLIQSERYIKNAIIDKVSAVSCSALLAGVHLYPSNAEFVKKWSNEIQEKLNSRSPQTHYHALILLKEIRKQDRNSFLKVLINLCKENECTGVAGVQLIRYIREMVNDELDQQNEKIFVDFLGKQLHKTSDMVGLEAAKTLCEFKSLPNKEIAPAVSLLTFFLTSPGSVNKLAALRVINKVISNPARVVLIQNISEIEGLLKENNRSLSAFAISILLKISKEDSVEGLLNQVEEFIGESSEEFKVDILSSVKSLVKKHPRKYRALVNFLSHCLKNEGQYEFKSAAVTCLENVIQEIPDAREVGLFTLAEFIEDCQYPSIHIQVMNLLAKEAQNIPNPAKIARLINNRTLLEGPEIRAAAITTLGKFAQTKPKLIPQIKPILEQAVEDTDSEVRARAIFYLEEVTKKTAAEEESEFNLNDLNMEEIDYIEAYLQNNIEEVQKAQATDILDMQNINKFVKENKVTIKKKEPVKVAAKGALELDNTVEVEKRSKEGPVFKKYQALFSNNPQFEDIGPLRLVSNDKEITDPQAEYQVKVKKILFDEYIVLEFAVKNTLENNVLFDVTVDLQFDTDDLKTMQIISINQIKTNDTSSVFVTVAKNPEFKIIIANVSSFLKFRIAEFSGNTKVSEYDDEYQLEDFSITVSDYIQPASLSVERKFDAIWKGLAGAEQEASYQLEYKTLESAIEGLIRHFGMHVCDNSDAINMANKAHSLMLSGTYLGYTELLLHALIGFQADRGCLMKLKSKSPDEALASNVLDCVN